jgi:hypothetical protein
LLGCEEVGFVDDDHGAAVSFRCFRGEKRGGLGHDFCLMEPRVGAESGDDGDVEPSCAECGVRDVDDVVSGRVEGGDGGADGDGFAGADSEGDRLQHLRSVLPCVVLVSAPLHPLVGRRLKASSFYRRAGELLLVVDLPDGSPGMIPAAVTDVFGERPERLGPSTVLTVAGVRALRSMVAAIGVPKGAKRRK